MPEVQTRLSREEVLRRLRSLPRVLVGLEPDRTGEVGRMKQAVADLLLTLVQDRWRVLSNGGTYENGESWQALKPATLASRRRKQPGQVMILEDTRRLFDSLKAEVTPTGAQVSTTISYAPFVHAQRPLWPTPDLWPSRWRAALNGKVLEGLAKLATALVRG